MTETAKAVLAKASLYDPTFSRPDMGILAAWVEALGAVDRDDALAAVTAHYRAETRRIMPADVLRGVKAIRADRLQRTVEAIPDADPDDVPAYLAAVRQGRSQVAAGERQRPVAQLVAKVFRGPK